MSNPTVTLKSVHDKVPTAIPYGDATKDSHSILQIEGTYHRHAIAHTPRGEFSRREFEGPVLEGPWAATFGLSVTLHNGSATTKLMEAAAEKARTIYVTDGTVIRIDGDNYEVAIVRREFIKLTPVSEK